MMELCIELVLTSYQRVFYLGNIMKKITLSRGLFALVDDEDYEFLNQWKWNASFEQCTYYAVRKSHGPHSTRKDIRMHNVIMSPPSGLFVDHIYHNGLDNQRRHLRICTRSQNAMNRKTPTSNTSGHKGVSWDKVKRKWRARIQLQGKKTCLGFFDDIEDAVISRLAGEIKYFGEYRFKSQ